MSIVNSILIAAALGCAMVPGAARAADVKVLASSSLKEVLLELVPPFEKSSGHKITIGFAGTANLKRQIDGGETFDLLIASADVVAANAKDGKIAEASRTDIARTGVGMAVRAGAPRPDIGSREAVKQTLLAAKTVAYSTGSSGAYVQRLFETLGIADAMKSKSLRTASGVRVSEYIVKGDADLGLQQVSELVHEGGIEYLGPLPPDIQNFTTYAAGVSNAAHDAQAARAFETFLIAPAAASAYRGNGMEPAPR